MRRFFLQTSQYQRDAENPGWITTAAANVPGIAAGDVVAVQAANGDIEQWHVFALDWADDAYTQLEVLFAPIEEPPL